MSADGEMSWGAPSASPVATLTEVVPADHADLAARGPTPIRSLSAGCPHPRDLLLGESCRRCRQEIIAVLRDRDGRNLYVTEDDLPGLVEHAAYLMRQVVQLSVGMIRDEDVAQEIRDVELEDEVLLEDEAEELMREVQSDG